VNKYENFDNFLDSKSTKRIISFSKKNGMYLKDFKFQEDDVLLFGREDSGLPDCIIDKSDFLISIFMPNLQTGANDHKGVRSLNLSVACGIAIYEAHKQINFQNGN
jgi:Predicted rRNA methylase (SpoU class)